MQASNCSFSRSAFVTRLALCSALLGLSLVRTGAAADAANVSAGRSIQSINPIAPLAVPGDENWSAVGSGMNYWVLALAVDASGDLYAGGIFTSTGGTTTNHIAK